jgi:type I restriction enzyme M protein
MAAIGEFELVPPDQWLFPGHATVLDARRQAEAWFQAHATYEGAERSIEEFVRQWALRRLLDAYRYPAEWIGERIVIGEPVRMGSTEKEADISIRNSSRRTFLYVETKKRGVTHDEFKEAERQLETYLASTPTATIGLITDGDRVRTLRKKIDPGGFELIADLPSYGLEARYKVQLVREMHADGRSTGLRLLNADYERVLYECHSAARDVDGLHADEALDEICKIIYTKVYDERQTSKHPVGTPFTFQAFGVSNASEVASNIRVLYDEARTADLEINTERIPGYERSRGVFRSQIRLSDSALYRVVERLQEFSLVDSQADIKGRAFQKVLGPAIRAGMGQYFTPDPIVELAVGLIQPKADELILDPFCGSGHFLTKASQYVVREQGSTSTPNDLHEFKCFHLHGIEKSDRMVRIAMTDMMLNDDGHTSIRNQDALLSLDNYPDITALRDNGHGTPAVFDVVLTNPPFGSIMRQETMEMMGRFELGHRKKSLPLEILGLERSLQFLRPGGRLAIVLPEHLMKGKSALFVRKWLEGVARLKGIFFFPEEAFTPYGALVKTCLCIVQRLKEDERPSASDKTFLCEVENLGYDATGRPEAGSEIQAAMLAFHQEVSWQ